MADTETETGTTRVKQDLSWLEGLEPTETAPVVTNRGRQPGKNPMTKHVQRSLDTGAWLQLQVPADVAKDVERKLRRAAGGLGASISVQVKTEANGGPETVIPLREVRDLEGDGDVYVAYKAEPKPEVNPATATESATKDEPAVTPANSATADPFANSGPATTKSGKPTASAKGIPFKV
jgi:hypothetical protein